MGLVSRLLGIEKPKEPVVTKPLSETDFVSFAAKASERELVAYIQTLPKDGKEINLITKVWGHSFQHEKKIGEFVFYGIGFYTSQTGGRAKVGDILLMNSDSGRIGRYVVLKIKYERNPSDMFDAYLACIGFK